MALSSLSRQSAFFGHLEATFCRRVGRPVVVGVLGVRMHIEDSRLIVRFQRFHRNAGRETVGTTASRVNR